MRHLIFVILKRTVKGAAVYFIITLLQSKKNNRYTGLLAQKHHLSLIQYKKRSHDSQFICLHIFQVSWIRTQGIRVLAIGKVRYTQDTRFTPLHDDGNDLFALKIQETRLSDAGLYECQVSYHEDEEKLKMSVRLIVLGKQADFMTRFIFILSLPYSKLERIYRYST